MLRIDALIYRIGGKEILRGASLTLAPGQHVGLVGRNGSGKSTLLKLLTGKLHADAGTIEMPRNWRIGMLAQEAPDGPQSLLETVLEADQERSALLAELATLGDDDAAERIGLIHARLADIEAHSAPARAARILAGLGFDAEAQTRPCRDFSGGWRMRVALAAVLFSRPDLLLLDEPTNHLDLEATLWLEDFLRDYPYAILLVSHDRHLLNRIAERIIHLKNGGCISYGGNYDAFEETRRLHLAQQKAEATKQEARRKHMQAFVDRFRYKESKARQAQSRLKMLAKMQPIALEAAERTIPFRFPEPEELAPPLLTLDDVAVGYKPGAPVLRQLDFRLDPMDRVALLGKNGNGKSTLLKLLSGRLPAMSGERRGSAKLRIGYFAQHQTDELDMAATPLIMMERLAPGLAPEKRRAHLGSFGFGPDKIGTLIGNLSGGEKARLLFAFISHARPHILLLDEPTNHLDIEARQALIEAVNDFAGAVIIVSHDPHLIGLTADQLWLVKDGGCAPYEGDLEDYRVLLLETSGVARKVKEKTTTKERRAPESASSEAAASKPSASEARAPSARFLRRNAEQMAIAVDKLTQALKLVETRLADPKLYADGPALKEWQKKHTEVARKLSEAETRWLAAQSALEKRD